MCYCEHCTANFQKATGHGPAAHQQPAGPGAARLHRVARAAAVRRCGRRGTTQIRKINPAARFIPNSGGGASADLDMKYIGEHADILFADRQARSGLAAPWANGKNGKEYRSTMGRKPIGGIFSVGVEEPYRWKDSVQSGAGDPPVGAGWRRQRAAAVVHQVLGDAARQALAEAGRGPVRLADEERAVSAERGAAGASRRWCTRSRRIGITAGRRRGRGSRTTRSGYYQALVEARIPFEMVHDQLLDAERLDRSSA